MNTFRIVAVLLLGLGALGCGPRYSPLAAHTLAAGENSDQDVVWITEDREVIRRCTNGKSGPVCTAVQMQ
jgi:hypothetical protein